MRTSLSLGVATALLTLVACQTDGVVAPLEAVSAATAIQSITGNAHIEQELPGGIVIKRQLQFRARKYADGSVDGDWNAVAGSAILGGTIVCYEIEDGLIRIGATTDKALYTTFEEGTDTGWYLEDNGQGNDPDDRSGRFIRNAPPGTAQQFCDGTYTDDRASEISPIYGGNVQVHGG